MLSERSCCCLHIQIINFTGGSIKHITCNIYILPWLQTVKCACVLVCRCGYKYQDSGLTSVSKLGKYSGRHVRCLYFSFPLNLCAHFCLNSSTLLLSAAALSLQVSSFLLPLTLLGVFSTLLKSNSLFTLFYCLALGNRLPHLCTPSLTVFFIGPLNFFYRTLEFGGSMLIWEGCFPKVVSFCLKQYWTVAAITISV